MNIKMFNGNNLPHELNIKKEKNMSIDIKLSKTQMSKII